MRNVVLSLFLFCFLLAFGVIWAEDQQDSSFLTPDRIYGSDNRNASPSYGNKAGDSSFLTPDRVYGVTKPSAWSYSADKARSKVPVVSPGAKTAPVKKSGCEFDSDCSGGRICVKTRFSSDGICMDRSKKASYTEKNQLSTEKIKDDVNDKMKNNYSYNFTK